MLLLQIVWKIYIIELIAVNDPFTACAAAAGADVAIQLFAVTHLAAASACAAAAAATNTYVSMRISSYNPPTPRIPLT